MKRIFLFLFCLSYISLYAQETEKEIKTEVTEVTVFLDGAQETRRASVDIPLGKTQLKFTNLSPFTDAKSIQVKADGEVTILTVNHQQNFLENPEKSSELISLENKLNEVSTKVKVEETYLEIIQEDLTFLKENRDLGGKDQALTVTALKEASDFYNLKLTSLKMKEIERRKTLEELYRQLNAIQEQVNTLTGKKEYAKGEVLVLIDSKKAVKVGFEITCMVENAGWFPSYDIRAKNVSEPIEVVYKANIRQDTKSDWKNVKLKLSSYNPSVSGVAPELKAYYLNYGINPPVYRKNINSISGRVTDINNQPLAGVSVRIEGSGVSTVTNSQGNYSLTLPANSSQLSFLYLGHVPKTIRISSNVLNVNLVEDRAQLDEVSVIGATSFEGLKVSSIDNALQGKIAGLDISNSKMRIRGASLIPEQQQLEKQISVDFEIKVPYTVRTDNKVVSVDMSILELPAQFQYYSVPKITKESFLIARLNDWEKYNFLEGEANVFFEDTYVGKTILNVNDASDTLSISLGRDKKVSVQREKVTDFSSKQFIGSKKEETREWKTTVKNNRSEIINMMVLDQVPVSTNSEIEVNVSESSGAKQNEEGVIEWDFKLEPGKNKVMNLIYKVKYPKNNRLVIE